LLDAHARGDRRRLRDERPDLPDTFIAIVERALDPDPAKRYASAGEMEAKLSWEPREDLLPAPVATPVSQDYFKLAAIGALVAAALTGALGFIAARFFEVVVQVDREFSSGLVDIFAIGARAVFAFIVLCLFGGAVVGVLAAARALFGESFSSRSRRVATFLESRDPLLLAISIALVAALSSVALNMVVFGDLFGAMFALASDPATTLDVSILGPLRQSVHRNHAVLAVYLSVLLGIASWRWFPPLERRTKDPSSVRLLKWGTLAVAFMTLAFAAAPRRILWERFPVVTFDNRVGFVIGTVGDELLVYAPSEPGRPRVRIRRDATGLRRTGEIRFLFDPEVQK
jgi:hypothetical protein